jgi:acyl-CoA thioesterase-1
MGKYCLSIIVALAVAACSNDAPAPEPTETQSLAADPVPVMGTERRILAFGDSLFAGYNVEPEESYPARLEASLRAQGINARITNGAVSGDTSAAGLQRLTFLLDNQPEPPELAIVELGGNDMLRGLSPAETRQNIAAVLQELKGRGIAVLLMGMRAPPNLGVVYQREFDHIYPELAGKYGAALVPFLLEPVYDKPDLIQADKIHPTARGIEELVAATADDVVRALPKD